MMTAAIAWRLVHVLALMLWFGSAAADVILELSLGRERGPDARAALVRLHRRVDLMIEGPALLLAVGSGLMLLWSVGLLAPGVPWPDWLVWKVACGGMAAALNLACVGFVVARARAEAAACGAGIAAGATAAPAVAAPGRRWDLAIAATGVGVPFALAALFLAVVK